MVCNPPRGGIDEMNLTTSIYVLGFRRPENPVIGFQRITEKVKKTFLKNPSPSATSGLMITSATAALAGVPDVPTLRIRGRVFPRTEPNG